MLTAEISTSTPTRFEPPWFSSEELGETIESLRCQSRPQRSLSTEPPTVMSGAAECVYVNVEHETPARNLQVFRQAWSGAQGMLSMEPRAIVFSRAPYPTAITSRTVKQLADVIESALSSIAKASAEKPAVVEQEFELIVTPESKQVRHVTARIVSRGRGEPNPVLD